jgi:hypothetical protein
MTARQADEAPSHVVYPTSQGSTSLWHNERSADIAANVSVAIVAEPLFTSYNKTRFTLRVLELAARTVSLTKIGPHRGVSGKFAQASDYFQLLRRLSHGPRPDFIFLSEFKFSLLNVAACWLIARILGARLIGGPHTLSCDSDLLTDPSSQGSATTASQYLRRSWSRFRDRLLIRRFDILQSYTEQYAARVRAVAKQPLKPTIILPVGSALGAARRMDALPATPGELRVMFWGIASALHGLSLLPFAARILGKRDLCVRFRILSPDNYFIREVRRIAMEFGVEDQFEFDSATDVSRSPEVAEWAELAISHLVNPGLNWDARNLVDTVSTNKMYEILDLGIPLLIASTSAVTSLIPQDCAFYSAPADAASVANAIIQAANPVVREQTARRGKQHHDERMAANAVATRLARELEPHSRAC